MFPVAEFNITNFRGIREARLHLDPRVTVFFGSNAGGKSTILDALAIALGPLVGRVPGAKGRTFARSGDIRVPWLDRDEVDEKAGVEASHALLAVHCVNGLGWDVARYRGPQARREARPIGQNELRSWIDSLVKNSQEIRPGDVGPVLPLVAAFGNERAGVEIPQRKRNFSQDTSRFKALDEALSATTRFKAVFEWFHMMENEENRQIARRQDLGYRLPALQWVRKAVEAAELRCSNPRIEIGPIRMMVDFHHADGGMQTLDIRQLSDGYRTHFALVVDLARRMVQLNPSPDVTDPDRGTSTPAVVLIDEVDLHLDPVWQSRVVSGLLSAFPRTQFVLSTHSEQVIGSVTADQVRRLRWQDGEIIVEPVAFAQGATGERILVDLMGAWERVPGPVTADLRRYVDLVDRGDGQSDQANALRRALEAAIPADAALTRADLVMQRQALMAKLSGDRG